MLTVGLNVLSKSSAPEGGALSKYFAEFLGISYGGTRYNAFGDKAVFVEVADALPYFPDTLPVDQRLCYWNIPRSNGRDDVVICSLFSWRELCWQQFENDATSVTAVQSYIRKQEQQESHRAQKRTVWQQNILDYLEQNRSFFISRRYYFV